MISFTKPFEEIPDTNRALSSHVSYRPAENGNKHVLRYCFGIPNTTQYDNRLIKGIKELKEIVPEGWTIRNGNLCTSVESEGGLPKAILCAKTYCKGHLNAIESLQKENPADEVASAFSKLVGGLNIEENNAIFADLSEDGITHYLESVGFHKMNSKHHSDPK